MNRDNKQHLKAGKRDRKTMTTFTIAAEAAYQIQTHNNNNNNKYVLNKNVHTGVQSYTYYDQYIW